MLRQVFTFIIIFLISSVIAEGQSFVKGQLIVFLQDNTTISQFESELNANGRKSNIDVFRQLSKSLPIFLIESKDFDGNEVNIAKRVSSFSTVRLAQVNHYVSKRNTTPNDLRYPDQWQWNNSGGNNGVAGADVSAEKAWDITTGGLTASGDTIVVCVVDDGTDINHEDLASNIWYNKGEIPGNNIDDDNNGYIDDINGWNCWLQNGDVNSGNHGVNVNGMIGAIGNNDLGVTGINWNVKIMNVVYASVTEDAVIESYDYALQSRLLYNSSNGTKGAFIVAVNSSWGLDYGKPADAPIWCNFYDIMGEAGILNVAATSNGNIDVDKDGDLPTACPSQYLISVGRTTRTDTYDKCGYGPINIDLGAPGVNIVTTRSKNRYTTTSGTSFASPLVAGMVALLYSYPCQGVATLMHKDYSTFALAVKNAILNGVDVIPSYATKCLTGGRANAFNSLELMGLLCAACQPDVVTSLNYIDQNIYHVSFSNDENQKNLRYRPSGVTDWIEIQNVTSPTTIELTLNCTNYEFQMQTICDNDTSLWGPTKTLKSARCCTSLDNISFFTDNNGILNIAHVDLNQDVNSVIYYKESDSTDYLQVDAGQDTVLLDFLKKCTFYDIYVSALCIDSSTVKSDVYHIFSSCNSTCGDLTCKPGTNAQSGYIDNFTMNNIVSQTGNNNGYINYGDHLNLTAPDNGPFQNTINIKRNQSGSARIRLYIDFNNDGDLAAGELFWEQTLGGNNKQVTFTHDFYNALPPGTYKMRMMLLFNSSNGPCDADQGETEDYCLTIFHALYNECDAVESVKESNKTFTSIDLSWEKPQEEAIAYVYRYKELPGGEYTYLSDTAHKITIKNLKTCTDYEFGIYTVCFTDSSNFKTIQFKTQCTNATNDFVNGVQWKVFPNPFVDRISVILTSYKYGEGYLRLTDASGKTVYNQKLMLTVGDHYVDLDTKNNLVPGVYILTLMDDNGIKSTKLIKQ